jgi:hypothetical protein
MKRNFLNNFQYMPVPIDPGTGGGGSPDPVDASIYHAPEHYYIDIPSGYGIGKNEYVIDIVSGFGYINYFVDMTNGIVQSPAKKIGTNSGNGTESSYILFGNSWDYVSGSGTPRVSFQKPYTGFGLQKDRILWNNSLNAIYTYLILQKAVPVCNYITLDGGGAEDVVSLLAPNSTTTISSGSKFRLNRANSRGADVSATWTILKTDPAGTFQSAPTTEGVDYALTLGTLSSPKIEIQFLSNYNFEVRLTISGYTFASNPYQNFIGNTQSNTTTTTYFFTASTVTPTFDYEIKFPKISPDVTISPSTSLISSSPITTYQNQVINVSADLTIDSSCYWKKIDLSGSLPPELITKSESEWKNEIASKCDVILEIRRISNNELILSLPFDINSTSTITIQTTGDFNMKFITTLK